MSWMSVFIVRISGAIETRSYSPRQPLTLHYITLHQRRAEQIEVKYIALDVGRRITKISLAVVLPRRNNIEVDF